MYSAEMACVRYCNAEAARSDSMNVTTYSPVLTLLYVFALLWLLMGVDIKSIGRAQRWLILSAIMVLCVANHLIRELIGYATYSKLLFVCMHLPTFFLFLYITKRGFIKTAFMILTALVFTSPTVFIGNAVRRVLFTDSPHALLLANLISYGLMLLLAQFIFRNGFNYLIVHGDKRLFLLFSILPTVYYIYMLAAVNLDFSSLSSTAGYVVRLIPTIEVFVLYFMLPYIYKAIRETQMMKSAQAALQQKLDSTEEQVDLLRETNTKTAVYRHDIRHQFITLNGLLSNGQIDQAQEYLKNVIADLDAITPKRFCENEIVNLLCSSYDNKAKRLGVQMKINTTLPKNIPLSDTELCSVISNGLENALRAASQSKLPNKWVEFSCNVKQNKIFIQIQNPYTGQVAIRDGLPISNRDGHGYGCYSIQAIAQQNGGLCSFEAQDGLFALRLSFPLPDDYGNPETNNTHS